MNFRLAAANLLRNRWRTVLSVGGVAVATGFLIWMGVMQDAFRAVMVDSVISSEVGHLQIHSKEYTEEPGLQATLPQALPSDAGLAEVSGMQALAPRVKATGLVGHKESSRIARIVGVEPETEQVVTGVPKYLTSGRWLSQEARPFGEPREAVIGFELAKQLKVEVGSEAGELAVILQGADGSLGNDLVQVVGILKTGNAVTDRLGMFMNIADAQALVALDGRVHEFAARLDERADLNEVAGVVGDKISALGSPEEPTVRTWKVLLPELQQLLDFGRKQMVLIYAIVFFIAALGILNAQRMSALERRREFGVLMAIGMTPARLGRLLIAETALVSVVGGLVGLLVGGAASYYHKVFGFSMIDPNSGESLSFMGVSMGEIFFDPTLPSLMLPVVAVTIVGFLCGLWPARYGSRLDPARAIAGRS